MKVRDDIKLFGNWMNLSLLNRNHQMHVSLRFLILILLSALPVACAPSEITPPPPPPTASRTPLQLGPTSTPSIAPPTQEAAAPTATLLPIKPLSDEDWSRGPQSASVTIVVYSDFQ